jgi:hypothetical protein
MTAAVETVRPLSAAFESLSAAIGRLKHKRKWSPVFSIAAAESTEPVAAEVDGPAVKKQRPMESNHVPIANVLPPAPRSLLMLPLLPAAAASSPSAGAAAIDPLTKPVRLPKTAPTLAARGLVGMSKVSDGKQSMAYHELWFVVPADYTMRCGLRHSTDERQHRTEIPVRILQPDETATKTIDDLLIPAQDIGKLIGVRQANVSKDVIYKICGKPAGNDRKSVVVVHPYGKRMDAPTPSDVKNGVNWQPQVCIRVDRVVQFLAKRKKPAGVDAVLLAGLKAYPLAADSLSSSSAAE